MRKARMFTLLVVLIAGSITAQMGGPVPKPLLPQTLLMDIVNEASGEMPLQNEILLAGVNRNRKPEEYLNGYFETDFLLGKLREYGADEAEVIELPADEPTTWDAEEAELWMVEPGPRKIADLRDVATFLCSGSGTTDVTAGLVYVGPGNRDEDYRSRSVKGKIALVNGYPAAAQRLAVGRHGALGVVAWESSHPEFDRDEIGWGSIRGSEKDRPSFGFMVSERTGQELRDALERGTKIVLRAKVKARRVPYKERMVMGLLKGKERPEEEVVFTAHLYEGFAKQGANDNISGCTAILETLRVIKALAVQGKIPPLKRSIRFLFVPEISGTAAYLKKYPAIAKRFFANINHDMVGEGLMKNATAFRLTKNPLSLPTYLDDVAANFVAWVGETQRLSQESGWRETPILAPAGSRDPFPYTIDPYSGGSDHMVFVDGSVRVPSAYLNVWPDQWYHTSGDTTDKSDSTQFKRVVVISAATAFFLANAGVDESEAIMTEVNSRLWGRIGTETGRAEKLILAADAKGLPSAAKEALNVAAQAFFREKEAMSSASFFFKGDPGLAAGLAARLKTLDAAAGLSLRGLEDLYASRCLKLKIKPAPPVQDKEEIRLAGLVPVPTKDMGGIMDLWRLREKAAGLKYKPVREIAMAEFELKNFIDGKRTILDIRNAASAEYGPLPLSGVEAFMNYLKKLGMIEIRKK
jgi:aminopeptidase YwaD